MLKTMLVIGMVTSLLAFASALASPVIHLMQPQPTNNPMNLSQELEDGGYVDVQGMVKTFTLTERSLITVAGHVGFQIELPYYDPDVRHMAGVQLTLNGKRLPGTLATQNWKFEDHYLNLPFYWTGILEPGTYVIATQARVEHLNSVSRQWFWERRLAAWDEGPVYRKARSTTWIKAPQYNGMFVKIEPVGEKQVLD